MPLTWSVRSRIVAGCAAALAATLFAAGAGTLAGSTADAAQGRPLSTVTTWAASDDKAGGSLIDVTVRNVVHTTIGGGNLRIRLSNNFGTSAITFSSAYIGTPTASDSAAIVPGSNRRITFGGKTSVTIPAGGVVLSDRLPGTVAPGADLSVSLALKGTASVITAHNRTMQYTFKSGTGDWAADESADHFGTQDANWFFLDAITLDAPTRVGTMAALGDSITDGVGSTINANHRWTDELAARVERLPDVKQFGIANEGISGNRVTSGGGSTGLPGQTRLVRDVLTKPGIGSVFLFEGINDVSGGVSADDLIAADRQIVEQAHAMGKCVFAATITPANLDDADREATRNEINRYLRTTGDFDAVFDFDAVVRDRGDATRLAAPYDSGDHIHLSDAGYRAVADSIDLRRLTC
ncbi:GDSL-type esterase/lipase family protein [Actinoallomurus iriomotensis]|uniref:SGNH hydrolase n=1 Tax=Actinoallomurus iriomotensis TaxID=478107 RepID=A0A9W6RG33_9ACTN|nr:GDSL-type esterase/lipase family protein [Actinoallomurus iriomotensis]GLY74939.1 SGNH hydrolase [Actinoallomurus iriomotensis]